MKRLLNLAVMLSPVVLAEATPAPVDVRFYTLDRDRTDFADMVNSADTGDHDAPTPVVSERVLSSEA